MHVRSSRRPIPTPSRQGCRRHSEWAEHGQAQNHRRFTRLRVARSRTGDFRSRQAGAARARVCACAALHGVETRDRLRVDGGDLAWPRALKDKLASISKQGDRYLRSLFTTGALAVIRYAKLHGTKHRPWLAALLVRRPSKVAAVALANKIARMVWAMMTRGERYKEPVALRGVKEIAPASGVM
jgi:hypothetical protein